MPKAGCSRSTEEVGGVSVSKCFTETLFELNAPQIDHTGSGEFEKWTEAASICEKCELLVATATDGTMVVTLSPESTRLVSALEDVTKGSR